MAHGHDQIAGLYTGFKGGTVVEWGSDQCLGDQTNRTPIPANVPCTSLRRSSRSRGIERCKDRPRFHHPLDGALSQFLPGEFSDEFRLWIGPLPPDLALCPVGSFGETPQTAATQ